jgi:hypothetical protein
MNVLLTLIFAVAVVLCAHTIKRCCYQRSVLLQSRGEFGDALNIEDMGVAALCSSYFCAGALVAALVAGWWLS